MQILWFVICDGQIWDGFFWRTETQKNVFLISGAPVKIKCSTHTPRTLAPHWMTPSLWTLRLLLFKMTVTGDLPAVKKHSRYRKKFMKSLAQGRSPVFPCCRWICLHGVLCLIPTSTSLSSPWLDSILPLSLLFCRSSLRFSMNIPPSPRVTSSWSRILRKEDAQGRFVRRIVLVSCSFGRAREGP